MAVMRKAMQWMGIPDSPAEQTAYDSPQVAEQYAEGYYEEETPSDTSLQPISDIPGPELEASIVSRIVTIHPTTYNDAQRIGQAFREDIPVIMNLSEMSDADARRLVDFSAGLVYGLHGSIEPVTRRVYLLSPADVAVSTGVDEDNEDSGLFNQS